MSKKFKLTLGALLAASTFANAATQVSDTEKSVIETAVTTELQQAQNIKDVQMTQDAQSEKLETPSNETRTAKIEALTVKIDSPQINDSMIIRHFIANDNAIDDLSSRMSARMAEVQQKPSVVQNIHKYLPFVINKSVSEKQPYQMIEFFDFYCSYCKEAVPVVYQTLETNKDVGLSYFPLLPENAPKELSYVAFGLTKVATEKQKTYLTEAYNLLSKNTVTLDEVIALLKQYDISYTEEELKTFTESQVKLTKDLHQDLMLQGTPSFVLLKNGQAITNDSLEVLLGSGNFDYFDAYKSKIK